ncbi:MAG TPA: ATP-grasp domain-containing protein [Candidatus Bathyarchaeia archaeon]|nr:ATP-grasp domain-containing protein [Candidatus Bathyarchaeia archaeon]
MTSVADQSGAGKRILVIGYNTRHIICSAKRAGYYVESVSHYKDRDLIGCGDVTRFIRDEFPGIIGDSDYAGVKALVNGLDYDHAILAAGFETLELPRTAGNPPLLSNFINDKDRMRDKLQSLGYSVPEHYSLDDNLPFPVILKPKRGAGGFKNVLVKDEEHLLRSVELYNENGWGDDFLIEEYVRGVDASASVLSTGDEAVTLAINEQLIGLRNLGPMRRFSFCGSLTPLKTVYEQEIERISSSLAIDLGLIGTNGIDFIVGPNGPIVIEINPRFQGTLDTIEGSLGVNLVQAHIKSCEGELIPRARYRRFACRMICFAERDFQVTKACNRPQYMDIPQEGAYIERAKPIISAMAYGKSRDAAFNGASHYMDVAKRAYLS